MVVSLTYQTAKANHSPIKILNQCQKELQVSFSGKETACQYFHLIKVIFLYSYLGQKRKCWTVFYHC